MRSRYLKHPDVIGVAVGTKLTGGQATKEHGAIHFYVRKKRPNPKRPLPRFVFARNLDGSVDRSRKIPTDVIEIGTVRFACGAGSRLDNTNGNVGTACLLFRNKAPAGGMFVVTCAHVARGSAELLCDCCPAINPAGKVAFQAAPAGGGLQFDIAIAGIDTKCSQSDLMVDGAGVNLTGFMDRSEIKPGLNVDCALPVSLVSNANVYSYAGAVQVGDLLVDNAFLLAAAVMPGDSGGLLYSGSLAVGMVFALASRGWAFFHPIEDAIAFAQQQGDMNLRVF
ncbi:MAG TPA: hypothetical protein VKB84_25560 [Candidatus Binataceae bacterium]|nr:hypothetical protein [Candidatus Binataceae bacterium]